MTAGTAADTVTWTGRNTAEVREWLAAPEGEAWLVTKGMTASTEGQSWRYVRAHRAPRVPWPDAASGAVFDGTWWWPVQRGGVLRRHGQGARPVPPAK